MTHTEEHLVALLVDMTRVDFSSQSGFGGFDFSGFSNFNNEASGFQDFDLGDIFSEFLEAELELLKKEEVGIFLLILKFHFQNLFLV